MSDLEEVVQSFGEKFHEKHGRLPSSPKNPHNGGEPPESSDMSSSGERLSKLEGTIHTQQWAMGIVAAVMVGAMGILVAITLNLSAKVDALPGQISDDIQQIVSTMSEAITASHAGGSQPNIIVVPVPGQSSDLQVTPQNFAVSPEWGNAPFSPLTTEMWTDLDLKNTPQNATGDMADGVTDEIKKTPNDM